MTTSIHIYTNLAASRAAPFSPPSAFSSSPSPPSALPSFSPLLPPCSARILVHLASLRAEKILGGGAGVVVVCYNSFFWGGFTPP